MKKLITVILIITFIFVLAGCGANFEVDSANASSPLAQMNGYSSVNRSAGGESATVLADEIMETSNAEVYGETNFNNTQNQQVEPERKIIRNAYMDIEAENANELYDDLTVYAKTLGGFEFSCNRRNFDNFSVVDAVLKIPPENLSLFMSYAGEKGKIINSRVDSADVTDEFYDIITRLETKRRSLESYYVLLERAVTVEEIVYLTRTIDGIVEEIEAFEGRLRVLRNLVDMATVNLHIKQENDPNPIRKDIDWSSLSSDDMGYFIRTGFVSVINVIAAVFQWIAIALIVTLPIWFPTLLILFIIFKRRKKKMAGFAGNVPTIHDVHNQIPNEINNIDNSQNNLNENGNNNQ
ncbi:MAG: DUF4349 domain-containing protein [Oscillospiraceae bacterium]|nr:DUF4349 domain-containing protein [Oscillospiraceae bacterium]